MMHVVRTTEQAVGSSFCTERLGRLGPAAIVRSTATVRSTAIVRTAIVRSTDY